MTAPPSRPRPRSRPRTLSPPQFEKVDCKAGIHYITIGDGGNREEFATPWVTEQPEWSAIREYAYGHGQLHIENSTHALWQWVRDDDPWNPAPSTSIGDQAYFVRQQSHLHGVERC